jgi:hypothetical protein
MTDGTDETREANGEVNDELPAEAGVGGVGVYESDDGVVLYDTENPLAWIQSPLAVTTEEMA